MIEFGDETVRLRLDVDDTGVVRILDLAPDRAEPTTASDPRPILEVVTTGTGTGSPGRYDQTGSRCDRQTARTRPEPCVGFHPDPRL